MLMRTLGLFLLFIAINAAALSPSEFAYRAQIKTQDEATWYRLTLPMAVQLASQSSNLRDLRVFNADGEALPYSIVRVTPQSQRELRKHDVKLFPLRAVRSMPDALPMVRVHESTAGTVIDVVTPSLKNKEEPILRGWLLDTRNIDGSFEKLQLLWHGEIEGFQRFTVEASDDLQNWRMVSRGQIGKLTFNDETIVQSDVSFSFPAAKYLRLLWLDPLQAIELSAVQLHSVNTTTQAASLVWSGKLRPARTEKGDSVFVLPASISIDRIRFENIANNTLAPIRISGRRKIGAPWFHIESGIIYRLPTKSDEMVHNELSLSGVTLREIKLHIDQRGTAMPQPEISVGTAASDLVFLARGKAPYVLAVGSNVSTSAELPLSVLIPSATVFSSYENGKLKSAEVVEESVVQSVVADAASIERGDGYKHYALWFVLLLGVALLGGMAFQMLRKSPVIENRN